MSHQAGPIAVLGFSTKGASQWLSLSLPYSCQRGISGLSCSTRAWPINSFVHFGWLSQWGTPHHFISHFNSASEPSDAWAKVSGWLGSSSLFNFFCCGVRFVLSFLELCFARSAWLKLVLPFRIWVLHFIMDHAQSREFHHHLARAIMHLNCLAGFLPFFEPAIEWDESIGDSHTRVGRSNPAQRNLHTFVPLPSSSSAPTMASHGGIPTHMILNPEPNLRPLSSHSSHTPSSSQRYSSPTTSSSTFNGTWLFASDDTYVHNCRSSSIKTTFEQSRGPTPEEKTTLRRHLDPLTANPSHFPADYCGGPSGWTQLRRFQWRGGCLCSPPSSWWPNSHHRPCEKSLPPCQLIDPLHQFHLLPIQKHSQKVLQAILPFEFCNPQNPIEIITPHANIRPWTDYKDQELINPKNDSKSRPSWKSIGARLRWDPQVCKLRWNLLRQMSAQHGTETPGNEPEAED